MCICQEVESPEAQGEIQLELEELGLWLLSHSRTGSGSATPVMVCSRTQLATNQRLAYWATLSRQPKDNQDMYKRFLFHYSRTQELTHPVKSGFPPVHPLTRLATQLPDGRMKKFPQQRDHTATLGRPFFLFRPRNGRNTEANPQ
ncbi:neuromedin-S isoform X2 [Suricata suricatta]|uniref:neuromedin-S isoform X2 n=1 Tax=Suricata suricatta TaxID=37032 RepID=UPI001155A2CA|nr:neuromedin-S isoform X2 [Suricata suricatta]